MTTPETATPAKPATAITPAAPDVVPAVAEKAPGGKENVLPADKPVNKPAMAGTSHEAGPTSTDSRVSLL